VETPALEGHGVRPSAPSMQDVIRVSRSRAVLDASDASVLAVA
jgi:hypothetical protein